MIIVDSNQNLLVGTQVHFDDKKWIAVGTYNYQQLRREYISMYPGIYDGRFQHIEGYATYHVSNHIQILGGLTTQDYKLLDTKTKVKSEVKVGHKHVVKAKPKPGSKK